MKLIKSLLSIIMAINAKYTTKHLFNNVKIVKTCKLHYQSFHQYKDNNYTLRIKRITLLLYCFVEKIFELAMELLCVNMMTHYTDVKPLPNRMNVLRRALISIENSLSSSRAMI